MKFHARKLLCAVLALSMVLPFASCNKKDDDNGNDSGEKGPTITSVSELSKGGLGVDEPGQEIDSGFEAPTDTTTNAQQSGSHSYTIYSGFTVTMNVDINDYIVVNEHGMFFQLYDLATDLGWAAIDNYPGNIISVPRYTYDCGNGCTMLFDYESYGENLDWADYPQLHEIWVSFVNSDNFATPYYKDKNDLAHNSIAVEFDKHYEIAEYRLNGKGYALSHDDIVMITYVLWACAERPAEDPLINLDIENRSLGGNANNYTVH